MNNIISLAEGAPLNIASGDEWRKQYQGKGTSYGLETTFFNGPTPTRNFEFNATYGKATRLFEDLNNGVEYFAQIRSYVDDQYQSGTEDRLPNPP